MPFANVSARVFKALSIQRDAPASSGVYGLSNASGWIYIGESDNIQARLLEHLQGSDPTMHGTKPTGFSFELCHSYNREARVRKLISELHPICNRNAA
ncbi:MAG: GIY-YIG nuclease family protein [Bryobacteraceae bacterium]